MSFRHALARSRSPLLSLLAVAAASAVALVLSAAPADAFEDTAGRSYDDAVQALVAIDVLNGCTDGQFCPERDLNRGQLASILVRALDLPATETQHFSDLTDNVHADSINALAEAGITQGCSADAFCPGASVTREQLATLITAAYDLPAATQRHFDDVGGVHADGVNAVAEAGITAGCSSSLTAFCGSESVLRWQTAVFVARAMELVDTVELTSLEERREQQAIIDEQERQRREEERAQLQAQQEAEAQAARDKIWDDLARCESGGNWSINTGNGYYGGLQFSLTSWRGVGGSGYPHWHTREEQIYRAEILLSKQGWGAWPSCSRQLGYR